MTTDISTLKHLYPFDSNFINIRGFNYHYLHEGKGDPVVMLHGNPTWSFYFRNLVKRFSKNHEVIVPDHLGCGLSDKPSDKAYDYTLNNRVEDLDTLLSSLALNKKITLIVHDWGGMIGLAWALQNLNKVGRIVITNTSGFFPPGKTIPARLWIMRYLTLFAKPATLGLNLFSVAALYMATRKPLPPDVKKGLAFPYNNWNNRIATYEFVQDIPLAKQDRSYPLVNYVDNNLSRLSSIPMQILWGEHDFIFTMEYFAEWQKRFPDAEAQSFKSAGHYLFEDEPEKTMDLIESFIERHPLTV